MNDLQDLARRVEEAELEIRRLKSKLLGVMEGNGISATAIVGTIPGSSGYGLIQDEGVPLTVRTTINFVGAGVTAADSGGVTTVTIAGGGVGTHVILDSAVHTDTLTGTVVDGDLMIGNVTPKWSRLAIAIPAANVRNVLGIDNGELRPSWKTALDSTNPAAITTAASPGTSLVFAHRDHVHAHEAGHVAHDTIWDTAGDIARGTGADTAAAYALVVPAASVRNVLGVDNGETTFTWKAALDATNPAAVSTAASPGTSLLFAHRDHVHAHETAHLAHDTLWDTAGDLVVGTGADTAAKLALTVPAANVLNTLAVANGETTPTWKALFDGTNPAAIGTAAPGTSLIAAHRDHVHAGVLTALTGTLAVANGGTNATVLPTRTISFAAGGGTPTTTLPCQVVTQYEFATNDVDLFHLAFDATLEEGAWFGPIPLPDNYDGGTMTATIRWTALAGAAGSVVWEVALKCVGDGDAIDAAWGTIQVIADAWQANGTMHVSGATPAITPGGTPAGGEELFLRVRRLSANGSDTMTGDALFLGGKLEYGTSSHSD